jgi:outer membrane beta-barrel protein
VEVAPLYGKFALYNRALAHFSFVLNGGAGLAGTRHQLRTQGSFGDTGNRFMGSVGGGFRVQIGDRFAVRLEVRDLIYTARVDTVNGCSAADIGAMSAARSPDEAQVSSGCRVQRFTGIDPKTGENRRDDLPLALNLVSSPSSDVLNNVSFYAGFSYVF